MKLKADNEKFLGWIRQIDYMPVHVNCVLKSLTKSNKASGFIFQRGEQLNALLAIIRTSSWHKIEQNAWSQFTPGINRSEVGRNKGKI